MIPMGRRRFGRRLGVVVLCFGKCQRKEVRDQVFDANGFVVEFVLVGVKGLGKRKPYVGIFCSLDLWVETSKEVQ